MADRYRDDDRYSSTDSNPGRDSYGAQRDRSRDDQRSSYGYGPAAGSGYGNDRDTRMGYEGYGGRDYQDRYSQRGGTVVQGDGAQGRNWAERAGDEVKSWVGDDDAERRRQQDVQKLGRYPGDDRGQDGYRAGRDDTASSRGSYGSQYGEPGYGRGGDYGSARYSEGQGYGGRTAPTSGDYAQGGDRRDRVAGAFGEPNDGKSAYRQSGSDDRSSGRGYGARQSSYTPSSYSAPDDRGTSGWRDTDRVHDNRSGDQGRDNWASNNTNYDADRGLLTKAADEVKSWFGDPDAERRRELDSQRGDAESAFSGSTGDPGLGYTGSTSAYGPTHHDPDYQSYRKARMDEYDRDYHEYKQTKQKEFHDDFHAFRTQKTTSVANAGATGTGVSTQSSSGASDAAMGVGAGAAAYGASGSPTGSTSGYGASSSTGSTLTGAAAQVREHMVVDGSDGQGVGKVDHIAGSDIKLTKHDSTDGKHHLIPMSWVASVEGNKVKLNKTSDEAMKQWRVAEPAQGSGTVGTKTQA